MPTDKLFTGQRLDSTGLYYYGARYYDPTLGRFISPDTIVPNPKNPQSLNRYSYVLNNPLKYVDPSGHRMILSDTGPEGIAGTTLDEKWYQINTLRETMIGPNSLDDFQLYLSAVGTAPGVGLVPDLLNGAIYSARGDGANAAFSFFAAMPGIGDAAGAIKLVNTAVRNLNKFDEMSSIVRAEEGFNTSKQLKTALGPLDKDNQLHHIVEQSQIEKSGFDPKLIHNPANALEVSKADHAQISGYFNSIDPRYSESLRVRNWLATQTFDVQYQFGIDVLNRFGYFK